MAGQRANPHTDRWARQLHAGLDSGFARSFASGQQFAVDALTWTANREGTTAWRESAEHREGVEGVVVQRPRDMAKAD
jgi:hypothetical protein